MGLKRLFQDLAREKGIEIDPDELDQLGLADDEDAPPITIGLGDSIPGRAAGELEVFFEADLVKLADPLKTEDGLIWEPIARAGQWALRPDGKGGKRRLPLKIVAGRSKDQRREIGLQDVVDAFNDGAIEHVTVPDSHENKATQNNGYIEGLKIVKGKVKGKTVDLLMGGYDIKVPEIKSRMQIGAIPSRSAGFLYDYERTDTGKKYPVVLEHVALTPKPWLRGMPRFGRPLEALSEIETATATLSNEGPDEDEYVTILAEAEEETFLAEPTIAWDQTDSPEWLKQQVNTILSQARQEKQKARRAKNGGKFDYLVEDSIPSYRCTEAKPGQALISDGWGDRSNYWVAPFTVKDGAVDLADFSKWQATKQVWIPDGEREEPKGDKAPLSEIVEIEEKDLSSLELAQQARKRRAGHTNDTPRGGGKMADDDTKLQLSDEARRLIQAAEDRAKAAEEKLGEVTRQVGGLLETANVTRAREFISELRGMGLSEERGFTGMLKEVEQVMLADDGGVALQADHFADDKNTSGELTASDAVIRIFRALKTAEGTTLKLGEIVPAPSEKKEGEGDIGKPPKGDEEVNESLLSDAEVLARYEKDHPGVLARAGIQLAQNGGGEK